MRSIPQPSPLTGSWTAPSDQERPTLSGLGTVACEPIALDYPTHGAPSLTDPGGATVTSNSVTLALSFRAFKLNNGPRNVLFSCGRVGIELGGSGLAVRYNNAALWSTGVLIGKDLGVNSDGNSGEGNLVCVVVRISSTGIDCYVDEEGTVSTPSPLIATQTLIGLGAFSVGFPGGTAGNAMIAHGDVIDGAVSDPNRLALIAYLKADSCAPMFPTTQPLIGVVGDSISVPFAADTPLGWDYRMLANVRATYPGAQLLNTSISGSGISPTTGTGCTQYVTQLAHLSSARAKQVVILQQGTNSIVGALNSSPTIQNAAIDAALALQFALADAFRAAGAKVLIATVPDRTGLLGGGTQPEMDTGRARWNAAIVATGPAHSDGLVRLDLVSGLGANGDSLNTTNFSDGVHFTDAGHGLAEAAYTAAVSSLLA